MSLNFGEIVEPSTRAFWDDYDEETIDEGAMPDSLELIWYNDREEASDEQSLRKAQYDPFHFVVIEGQKVASFIGKVLLKGHYRPVCQLSCGTVTMFRVPAENLLLCVSEELDPNLFGQITQELAGWLHAAETVSTISLQPAVLYKGITEQEQEKACFIKALPAGKTVPGDIGLLKAPNVITGVAASVASYRKFAGKKEAAVYGCFLDSIILDSVSSEPILRLLKAVGVPCVDRYESKFKTSSNLYL